jgi:release factor glutamine methyltransferase
MPFYVNSSVLIPRPETEFLVIRLLDLAKQYKEDCSIVDVGTGSGIVAICAATYLPKAKITAIDISDEALEIARRNAETHKVADRIDFRKADLLSETADDEKFDFVVSNPPYVSESEFAELDTQVKDHEPELALLSGAQGTDHIERLVPQAASRLQPGGWQVLEISPMIREAVDSIVQSSGCFGPTSVTNDLAKLARIVDAQRSQ